MSSDGSCHPVLMVVPTPLGPMQGQEKKKAMSIVARKVLACSARYSGVALGSLEKEENGAPCASNGVFWSISHTAGCVAAVTAPVPVGIDIEKLTSFSPLLQRQIASKDEWDLAPIVTNLLFYRYWTAKEAVLKAVGKGLAGLANCTVKEIVDNNRMELLYCSERWVVTHYTEIAGHIAAITTGKHCIEWHVVDTPE